MWISKSVCLFMIYSFMGWIYESIFCTIKGGKWENRGFLYGPVCPIYGTGAVIISVIMHMTIGAGVTLGAWQIFIISVLGSAVLEYVTSWTLEKLFHAAWWDYSDLPLNLHGRISLFTSLGFGFGGLLIVYVIAPFTEKLIDPISPIWMELLALCLLFVFAVDLTLTVTALLHFDRTILQMEDNFNHSMEIIVDNTIQQSNRIKNSIIKKGRSVNEQIGTLSELTKSAVRRIYLFRDRDIHRKTIKNSILSKLRNAARRNAELHKSDDNGAF